MMTRLEPLPPAFDMECARSTVDAFAAACGVSCRLVSAQGALLCRCDPTGDCCAQCRVREKSRRSCDQTHLYGACQSERFGGRYIYCCPAGMAWVAAPILIGGVLAGGLSAGPVLIMEPEDYLASLPDETAPVPEEEKAALNRTLTDIPRRNPDLMSRMSLLLLACAVYLGDNSRALLAAGEREIQQGKIGEFLQQLKCEGAQADYPIQKERELQRTIAEGDQRTARKLLNELLGHILFSTGGDFSLMRTRSVELMSVLSRAAADGGADLNQVLSLNHRFLQESDYLSSVEDLTAWLNRGVGQYAALVFDLVDIKHKDIIYKAVDYMKSHYTAKLTLEETARYVGFSPSYFSKVFKEEMSCTFNTYLVRIRIEKSKSILLSGGKSVCEVCSEVGFEDQSYFIKVFRKYVGATPGQYRKRQGRLDASKERQP